ncbi:MAG: hypothetical protein AAF926_02510 [Pseudomonadota bacterium]
MQNLIKNFVNDESGATALGESINDKFADVSSEMDAVRDTKGRRIRGGD